MNGSFLIASVGLFAIFAAPACSSDDESKGGGSGGSDAGESTGGKSATGGKTGSGGSGGSGGAESDAGNTVSISGQAHEWDQQDPFATPVLAGVEVCLYHHPEVACSTTGADGAWALHGVPANAEVLVTLKKTGRISVLRPIKTGTTDIAIPGFENAIPAQADVAPLLPGVTVDFDKGGIVFFINGPGTRFVGGFDWVKGFSMSATPKSGEGPLYLDANEVLVPSATKSQGGWGHYVNLDDGEYTLTFTPPAGATCRKWADVGLSDAYGYPTDKPLTIRVPVVAGFTTYPVGIYCVAPPGDGGAIDGGTSDGGTDAETPVDAGGDAH